MRRELPSLIWSLEKGKASQAGAKRHSVRKQFKALNVRALISVFVSIFAHSGSGCSLGSKGSKTRCGSGLSFLLCAGLQPTIEERFWEGSLDALDWGNPWQSASAPAPEGSLPT
jgi:hypothetical protein